MSYQVQPKTIAFLFALHIISLLCFFYFRRMEKSVCQGGDSLDEANERTKYLDHDDGPTGTIISCIAFGIFTLILCFFISTTPEMSGTSSFLLIILFIGCSTIIAVIYHLLIQKSSYKIMLSQGWQDGRHNAIKNFINKPTDEQQSSQKNYNKETHYKYTVLYISMIIIIWTSWAGIWSNINDYPLNNKYFLFICTLIPLVIYLIFDLNNLNNTNTMLESENGMDANCKSTVANKNDIGPIFNYYWMTTNGFMAAYFILIMILVQFITNAFAKKETDYNKLILSIGIIIIMIRERSNQFILRTTVNDIYCDGDYNPLELDKREGDSDAEKERAISERITKNKEIMKINWGSLILFCIILILNFILVQTKSTN